ncbi:MAG: CDP-alcohol phosphatidyltransferase family protein [Alkalilacustris sp.]
MSSSPAAHGRPDLPARLRPAVWSVAVVVPATGLGAAALAAALDLPGTVAAVALALAAALGAVVLGTLWRAGPAARFALCSRVTLARAGVVAVLAGLLAAPAAVASAPLGWVVVALAATALALDGLDGWLARSRGEATAYGARFDMEVDAALGLVLAVLAVASAKLGPWVLGLGLMRYGFVAAAQVWPWLRAPLPDSFRRKTVCVVQIAVLAVLLAPAIPAGVASGLGAGTLGLLVASFGWDVVWLWRHRADVALDVTPPREGVA